MSTSQAATHVQRVWRGHIHRLYAARVRLRRKRMLRRRRHGQSALAVQRVWRGLVCRRRARRLRHKRAARRSTATLQRVWRGSLARRRVRGLRAHARMLCCTLTLQRVWRGALARACARQVRARRRREAGVLTLQRVWRGMCARVRVAARRVAARREQAAAWAIRRAFLCARARAMRRLELRSVRAIQSAWRQHARRENGRRLRRHLWHYRRSRAAERVQRGWRRHHARRIAGSHQRIAVFLDVVLGRRSARRKRSALVSMRTFYLVTRVQRTMRKLLTYVECYISHFTFHISHGTTVGPPPVVGVWLSDVCSAVCRCGEKLPWVSVVGPYLWVCGAPGVDVKAIVLLVWCRSGGVPNEFVS